MTAQQRVAFYLIPFLLTLYAIPLWVVAADALFGQFGQVNSDTTKWFVSLISHPDSSLNLMHKVFLPITTFVTVAIMWKGVDLRWTIGIVIGLLITIAISIYLVVYFGIDDTQANVVQTIGLTSLTKAGFLTLSTNFVAQIQEVLATYLLTLLGLQVATKEG